MLVLLVKANAAYRFLWTFVRACAFSALAAFGRALSYLEDKYFISLAVSSLQRGARAGAGMAGTQVDEAACRQCSHRELQPASRVWTHDT